MNVVISTGFHLWQLKTAIIIHWRFQNDKPIVLLNGSVKEIRNKTADFILKCFFSFTKVKWNKTAAWKLFILWEYRVRFVVIVIINVSIEAVPVCNTNKNTFFELSKLLFIIVRVIQKFLFNKLIVVLHFNHCTETD